MHLAESVFLSSGTGWVAAPQMLALKIKPNPRNIPYCFHNYLHPISDYLCTSITVTWRGCGAFPLTTLSCCPGDN